MNSDKVDFGSQKWTYWILLKFGLFHQLLHIVSFLQLIFFEFPIGKELSICMYHSSNQITFVQDNYQNQNSCHLHNSLFLGLPCLELFGVELQQNDIYQMKFNDISEGCINLVNQKAISYKWQTLMVGVVNVGHLQKSDGGGQQLKLVWMKCNKFWPQCIWMSCLFPFINHILP